MPRPPAFARDSEQGCRAEAAWAKAGHSIRELRLGKPGSKIVAEVLLRVTDERTRNSTGFRSFAPRPAADLFLPSPNDVAAELLFLFRARRHQHFCLLRTGDPGPMGHFHRHDRH